MNNERGGRQDESEEEVIVWRHFMLDPSSGSEVIRSARFSPCTPIAVYGSPECFEQMERHGFLMEFSSQYADYMTVIGCLTADGDIFSLEQRFFKGSAPILDPGWTKIASGSYDHAFLSICASSYGHRFLEESHGFRFAFYNSGIKAFMVRYENDAEFQLKEVVEWIRREES